MEQRDVGLYIVAALYIANGVAHAIYGFALAQAFYFLTVRPWALSFVPALLMTLAAFYIVVGLELLRGRRWAYITALVIAVGQLISFLAKLDGAGAIISGLMLLLLLGARHRYFRRQVRACLLYTSPSPRD